MSAFAAFLHHLAAFALVATLVLEFVLIKGELTLANAKKIQFADMAFGLSAGVLLIVGLLRVFFLEKGAAYYLHSWPFIAKLSLFLLVGLMSIYPTIEFLGWSKTLKRGMAPIVSGGKLRSIRMIMHLELVGVVLVILCAVLMARGVGFFG